MQCVALALLCKAAVLVCETTDDGKEIIYEKDDPVSLQEITVDGRELLSLTV